MHQVRDVAAGCALFAKSVHNRVCVACSRDCPIFYMRKKVQKDLDDATSELERFERGSLAW